ncbi:F-box protein [Melia azedarach]|uniref:F-box protein n=1 Tax=Melia azedarach TaxID=155640 RepID=A0ACC1YEG7_MELAZ|nr:F-box protein [Melia azedarach]
MFSRICSYLLKTIFWRRKSKTRDTEETDDYGCWDQLPSGVLVKIIQQISLGDCVRVSLVCKSWSLDIKQNNFPNRVQAAWLMLPLDRVNTSLLRFYDLFEGRTYNFELPKNLQGGWCCGSSKGWLAIVYGSKFNPKFSLYNPISGIQFPLPPLITLPSSQGFLDRMKQSINVAEFIKKVELSSVNAPNCIVAATFDVHRTLAVCKPGDKRWTAVLEEIREQDDDFASDILFYNGELHVLTSAKTAFATHTIKLGDNDDDVIVKFIPDNFKIMFHKPGVVWYPEDESGIFWITKDISIPKIVWIAKDLSVKSYLIESDGELLIVHKTNNEIKSFSVDDGNGQLVIPRVIRFEYSQANRFIVFKIDDLIGSMRRTRLDNLENQILFVAESGSLCVAARDIKIGFKNCVFFLGDLNYLNSNVNTNRDPYVYRESGVFYLEDGRIERTFPCTNQSVHCRMNWFSPNILF